MFSSLTCTSIPQFKTAVDVRHNSLVNQYACTTYQLKRFCILLILGLRVGDPLIDSVNTKCKRKGKICRKQVQNIRIKRKPNKIQNESSKKNIKTEVESGNTNEIDDDYFIKLEQSLKNK